MSRKRVIIIHGTEGTPESHWLPWLATQITAAGHDTVLPRLPTPQGQELARWKSEFYQSVGLLVAEDILVGYSVGATFALRLLEETATPVTAAFIVAGFDRPTSISSIDPLVESFIQEPFDWELIKGRGGKISAYHGADDPIVPPNVGEAIAQHLNAPFTLIPNGGHLNTDSGYTQFPQLWDDIQELFND